MNLVLNNMEIINNKKEFISFHPYGEKNIKKYPKKYPCIVKKEILDGGIMGDYIQTYVTYFPKSTSLSEVYLLGLENNWLLI